MLGPTKRLRDLDQRLEVMLMRCGIQACTGKHSSGNPLLGLLDIPVERGGSPGSEAAPYLKGLWFTT